MIRNLKVLGLALASVLAMAAVTASAASATPEFHSAVEHTILTAEQVAGVEGEQKFNTPAGNVTCKKVIGKGTTTTKTTMSITAEDITYKECKTKTIFGEISVEVDFKGCDYKFTTATEPVHIECPAGSGPITISGPGCTITVGAQTVSSVSYVNTTPEGGKKDIDIVPNVTNISGSATGAFCSKTGAFTSGTYSGKVTVRGFNTAEEQVDIWYE